ncbi:uncharacterized protein LOC142237220 [Haematobia irritans]|uniref:uncharacterized protein LOC142237220 n=1 Tax=Haematobia irritans TaxID=7368 RepID=UPI003F4FA486
MEKIFLKSLCEHRIWSNKLTTLLLHHLGPDCLEVFNSLDVDMDSVKYDDLMTRLDAYFIPKVNIVMERHKFFTRKQTNSESIEEYITSLKNLSLSCEFGALREDLVKDIFICGLLPNFANEKERLLREKGLTLEKAIQITRSITIAKESASQLQYKENFVNALQKSSKSYQNRPNNTRINKPLNVPSSSSPSSSSYSSSKPSSFRKTSPSQSQQQCSRCGQLHKYKCPAEKVNCHSCHNQGHYAKMCFFKSSQQHERMRTKRIFLLVLTQTEVRDNVEESKLSEVDSNAQLKNEWIIKVDVNKAKITFQVDTGAQANILSKTTANFLILNHCM